RRHRLLVEVAPGELDHEPIELFSLVTLRRSLPIERALRGRDGAPAETCHASEAAERTAIAHPARSLPCHHESKAMPAQSPALLAANKGRLQPSTSFR